MDWAGRGVALKEAFGVRKYVVLGMVGGIATMLDALNEKLHSKGIVLFNDPSFYLVAAGIVVLLVAFWIFEYAYKLRQRLTPKVELSFSDSGGVVSSPVKDRVPVVQNGMVTVLDSNERTCIYIRGLVKAISDRAVVGCVAYLVGVRKMDPQTKAILTTHYLDDIQLPWSGMAVSPITIPAGVRRYFDIIQIDEKIMEPYIATGWPLTLRKLFDDKTTYQLDLLVNAEGISVTKTIEFTWTGKLDEVTAKQV